MCSRWKFGWNKFIFGWKPLHCDTLTTSTVGCFQWFARGNCVHNIGYICLSLEYKLLFLILPLNLCSCIKERRRNKN